MFIRLDIQQKKEYQVMAKFTGWKKRYSYLDDYKKGIDGKYVYYGRHYIFCGDSRELRIYKWTLGITDILLTALFVIGGLMDGGAIWRAWYVVIPFALEVVALFLLIWKSISLILEKVPIKAYMYKRTVPWFRPLAWILIAICLLSLIATLVCMLVHPGEIKTQGCILYMVIKFLSAAAAWAFLWRIGKSRWELDPSEEME